LVAYLSAAKPVEVLVDATGQFEPGGVGPELQVVPASLVAQEMMEGLECPVSDRVALGTACQCGGTKCEKSNFCYALEEDGTPSCEEMSRQDPSLLDLYGISKNGPADGKDVGAINGRELKFYKKSANSGLRFFYSDNFRVYGSHSASRWELKIDGATCPSGKMAQDLHVQPGMNPHRINGFGFHCKGVGKGDHKVTVHVGPTPGYTSAGRHDAYTGNGFGKNAAWHLEAQEIPADYQLYHFKSGAGPDGRSSGVVNGRTLKFKKLYKDSRLRLFYSDNLRSYSGSYASCRWTIRVDGQACKSGNIAGDVYVHPYDNPLRPRSFAGYCDDVSVGEHTVDVFIGTTPGYSSCGGHTGWTGSGGGAHYLLEAEEIPNPSSYPMLHYKMAHTSDGRDAGALAHYQLSFEKKNKETTLRLFFTENLRAYSHQHSCACTWELLVDSKHCGNVEIFGQVYVWRHHSGNQKDTNPHRVRSFAGFCENVPAGTHQAVANVRQRGTSHCDCYTGWLNSPGGNGAHGVLEVHEFFKPCPGFEKGDCQGHCYWSEEAGICSKAVPCPGHDKIAVGSTCLCGDKEAKEGQFCYEDSTVADSAKPEKSFSYSVPISWTVFLVTPLALWIG